MTLVADRPETMAPPAAESETKPQPAAEAEPETGGLVIFALSGDLERTWATLILANAAAAMGKPVTVFYTFWGLFTLVRNDAGRTGNVWMQKMLSVMNPGGTSNLKLSKMNFMGMGPWMMHSLAKKYSVSSPQELLESARDLGVKLIPCQMTMDMMGLKREDLIDGLEEPAGAATALAAAEGAMTLFI